MALAFTALTVNQSETDAGSYTTASVTLTAGHLYLVGVHINKAAQAPPASVATTGGGITFTQIAEQGFATINNASVWRALPTATVTDTIVITLASATGCVWSVVRVIGVRPTGTNGADAIVQSAKSGQTTGTTLTTTLTNNIIAGNGRYVFRGVAQQFSGSTVTSGTWTVGTIAAHANPPAHAGPAWNSIPATTDKSSIVTPGAGTSAIGAIIMELASRTDFVGMIPL